ncbi:MAG TPA: hypothetical protein VGC12_00825 [Methyloradius sp.]
MYSDEDLSLAIKSGIFTEDSVSEFRAFISKQQNTVLVDEEHFRLVTGFNDFFVVIASFLLLVSVGWLGMEISKPLGALGVAATSWGLAEFFVRRRKMALPAIVLLIIFVVGIAFFAGSLYTTVMATHNSFVFLFAGLISTVAARLHWLRFKVPITVAIGVGSVVASIVALFTYQYPEARQSSHVLLLFAGFLSFALAMRWDAKDTQRKSRKSDVAFWLHLLAAPLIVHPIFSMLGVFEGSNSVFMAIVVISLYIILGIISIAIDRRALMVSALVYVLFAFTSLLKNYGIVSLGFALTGLVIGSGLLLLSAYWHSTRRHLLNYIPKKAITWLPPLK